MVAFQKSPNFQTRLFLLEPQKLHWHLRAAMFTLTRQPRLFGMQVPSSVKRFQVEKCQRKSKDKKDVTSISVHPSGAYIRVDATHTVLRWRWPIKRVWCLDKARSHGTWGGQAALVTAVLMFLEAPALLGCLAVRLQSTRFQRPATLWCSFAPSVIMASCHHVHAPQNHQVCGSVAIFGHALPSHNSTALAQQLATRWRLFALDNHKRCWQNCNWQRTTGQLCPMQCTDTTGGQSRKARSNLWSEYEQAIDGIIWGQGT